ncbi:MAG: hypothetical protein KDC98_00975 [Planctomycetes bacterium]|nr:hypothetical protein [Planctomycetota bacterium]
MTTPPDTAHRCDAFALPSSLGPAPARGAVARWALPSAAALALLGWIGLAVPARAVTIAKNELAAIAQLKNISSAQAQCQAAGVIDVNNNGAGEYGFFGELSGAVAVRGGSDRISPQVLSNAFAKVVDGRIHRGGYVFQIYLPDHRSLGVGEDATGGDPDNGQGVSPSLAEVSWACYAWPETHGGTGQRAFFIDQAGDILASENTARRYSGAACKPGFDAALGDPLPDRPEAVRGADGEVWTKLGPP